MKMNSKVKLKSVHQKVIELKHLNFAERLLVVSVRLWVKAYKQNSCTISKIRYLYTAAGVSGVAITLDGLMQLLSRKATGNIEINCPNSSIITQDEERFLTVIAIWQFTHTKNKAESLTSNWLSSKDNINVQKFFAMLAYELKEAHFMIRPRNSHIIGLPEKADPLTNAHPSYYHH
ncbi:MAG: hypothetical protein CFH06_00813 [Alphaproteobacteria bacterium MarineAlpha3_Bin5]|nr:hypothetical protein [Magnetovibrio sp.]PPR78416.1 MAG: hypothetical protein CFH06_00813 [Alphaproteobacteria bacterium MarineAlpha3_Bin5]|tara:strand:+ start:312 stop:839 length:528 start_codon:yes stop_codon:yes gene_type:complete